MDQQDTQNSGIRILEIENKILSSIDNLDNLFSEYLELDKPIKRILESWNPFLSFKKRGLIKSINLELNNIDSNLDLLIDTFKGTKLGQFGESLEASNDNVKKMATKLVKMASKYINIKGQDSNLDHLWGLLQYQLKDQDHFTKDYNTRFASKNTGYEILSILNELKDASNKEGVSFDIFLSKTYPKLSESNISKLLDGLD